MEVVEVGSIQDLISILDKDAENNNWFRGQRNVNWDLKPYLQRLPGAPSETTLLTRFRQNALRMLETPARNDFDWMFLMQHYGVPTRLLDWSENALIALYFAVIENSEDDLHDGALWELDPVSLNSASGIDPLSEPGFIPSFDDDELKTYSMDALKATPRTQLKPIATIAARNSARIQAQSGVFTVHHLITDSLEAIHPDAIQRKMVIPAKSKVSIRAQLSKIGFTRFHLFPEMESIGAAVRESIK